MTPREKKRRTYDVTKEALRAAVCRSAEKCLREQRDLLRQVGAEAAAGAVRVALKSIGGAIRHADARLRYAESVREFVQRGGEPL